jgi:AraC family transcriptional regulator
MTGNHSTQDVAGVYGRSLGEKFGAEDAPSIMTRSLRRAEIAITDICVDRPLGRLSDPIPSVSAYMICLMLRDIPNNSYWEDGRQVSCFSNKAGEITIHDLRRQPLALMDKPFHSLLFYLPSESFNTIADQANVPRISELQHQPGLPIVDETIKHVGLALLPALQMPDRVNTLFIDHVALALAIHTAQTYGGMRSISEPRKGGLAPWQEKRAKEMIAANLSGTVSLREIAEACGLSVSHFSRAFRVSTGLAPHAWLLKIRVDSAMVMLRKRNVPLSVIAHSCGFADRSHLNRVFTRHVGLSPGAWRRIIVG